VTCTANRHGTTTAYRDHRCRCESARVAVAEEKARYRKRLYLEGPLLLDKTGTLRRVQALARMGWSVREVARRAGVARPDDLLNPRRLVHRDTATAVDRVFRELCMTPGPSARAKAIAERRGYAGPLDWDDIDDPSERPVRDSCAEVTYHLDEVAIEETMAGRRVKLSHEERQEVFRRLIERGLNASQIAQRLGMTRAAAQKMATRVRSRGQVAA
jgi:hypothetical protein